MKNTMQRTASTFCLSVLLPALLSACSGEPSGGALAETVKQTINSRIDKQVEATRTLLGDGISAMFDQNLARVSDVRKIACKELPDKPGYLCDFEVTRKTSDGNESKQVTSARFVKADGGWMLME